MARRSTRSGGRRATTYRAKRPAGSSRRSYSTRRPARRPAARVSRARASSRAQTVRLEIVSVAAQPTALEGAMQKLQRPAADPKKARF